MRGQTGRFRQGSGGTRFILRIPIVRWILLYYFVGSFLAVGLNLQVGFLAQHGLEPHMAGVILGASSALAVVTAALGGNISDQRGARACFLMGLPLKVFGCVLMAAASHNPWVGAVGLITTYGSDAMLGPAVTRAVADAAPLQLAATLGLLGSVRSLVPIAGSLASAIVAESLGWECLFLVKACLVSGVSVLLLTVPLGRSTDALQSRPLADPARAGYMEPGLLLIVMGAVGLCALDFAPVFLPYLLSSKFTSSAVPMGILDSIYNLVWAVGALPAGILADRVGAFSITLVGYMLMGLSRLIYPFAPSLSLVYLASLVGAAGNCLGSNAPVFAVRLLGERRSGVAAGYFSAAVETGSLIGMTLGGVIWSKVGPVAAFLISSLGPAWAMICYSVAGLRHRSQSSE